MACPGVPRPRSLHNIASSSMTGLTSRPCRHEWGPCANDHTHHHARSGESRASSTGRSSGRSPAQWEHSSSDSSGSGTGPVARKLLQRRRKLPEKLPINRWGNQSKSERKSLKLENSRGNSVVKSDLSADTGKHRLCIKIEWQEKILELIKCT